MRFLIPAFVCLAVSAFAQGGAAILTLDMPPPGGEGYSSLQSGGAFPTGATSLYYNPALLAELERSTGSQFHTAYAHQDWPSGFFPGLSQTFSAASVVLPSLKGFDLGIGFFRNQLDYGQVLTQDSLNPTYHALENVYGLGAALRLGLPVSVGGTLKYYDSRLGPGESARATGWAYDLGISANPHFRPLASQGIASLEAKPAAGAAVQNMGREAWYSTPSQSDPLPRAVRGSLGLETDFADLAKASIGHEWQWSNYSARADAIRTFGVGLSLAGFRYGWAWLEDPSGGSSQRYETYQYEFDGLQSYRLWQRVKRRDFVSASEGLETGYPFKKLRFLGSSYRFNPRFVIGRRVFREDSQDLRTAQKAWFVSLAL
jgi:hypothetical protein